MIYINNVKCCARAPPAPRSRTWTWTCVPAATCTSSCNQRVGVDFLPRPPSALEGLHFDGFVACCRQTCCVDKMAGWIPAPNGIAMWSESELWSRGCSFTSHFPDEVPLLLEVVNACATQTLSKIEARKNERTFQRARHRQRVQQQLQHVVELATGLESLPCTTQREFVRVAHVVAVPQAWYLAGLREELELRKWHLILSGVEALFLCIGETESGIGVQRLPT